MLAGLDDDAAAVDAANTVVFGAEPGDWHGANTDVPGLLAALGADGGDLPEAEPWVIGAGATARSALAALARLGYRAATVVARRPEALDELASSAAPLGIAVNSRAWTDAAAVGAAALVISTAPAGATDVIAAGLQGAAGVLLDVVYAPWPTALAEAWAAAGGTVIGGLELLVEQAAIQVKLMTGESPPVEVMRQAGYAALGRQR
jgi:shikimate dehydrogenase